jgi:Deacetylase PdaC
MMTKIAMLAAALLLSAASLAAETAKTPQSVSTKLSGKGYDFGYSYPVIVNKIPKLRALLEKSKKDALASIKAEAASWTKDNPKLAKEMKLDSQTNWKTAADLPTYLSLTTDEYSFNGGAHGIYGRTSAVWDKKAGKMIEPQMFFSSGRKFDDALQLRYCDLLDIERSKKRDGEKVDRTKIDDWMQACPKPSDLQIILGSSDGKTFNRLAIYAGPYAVGPYSEGDYEINLPVTEELMANVEPQYRSAFSVTANE